MENVNFHHFREDESNCSYSHILISVSGYESRATYLSKLAVIDSKTPKFDHFLVFGFSSMVDLPGRLANDSWYKEQGRPLIILGDDSIEEVFLTVEKKIADFRALNPNRILHIHVDYSSMPRSWYCGLLQRIPGIISEQEFCTFWYSLGQYTKTQSPTAGIDDFVCYSGKPSLGATRRQHIIGLGFDAVRTSAIFTVLDPQEVTTFYGVSSQLPEYRNRILRDNYAFFEPGRPSVELVIDDYLECYSKLRSIIRDAARFGDAIVVPDGPKPLVLAASTIVRDLDHQGIVCIHVRRRKDKDAPAEDIQGTGQPIGFSIAGRR